MIIIFSGLPGVGKTTLAKDLARRISATYLRIDSIEQAIRNSGLKINDVEDSGYNVGYALAVENLKLGNTVIADSVNSIEITRQAWLDVAKQAGSKAVEVEVICSDPIEHRARVETRRPDIAGHKLPGWQRVLDRKYEPYTRDRIIVDTANMSKEQALMRILSGVNS